MSIAVSIRLPEPLAKELDVVARATERPRSFHIQKALEAYVEEMADAQIALDRMRDPKDQVVSSTDMRKRLGV
jgi:RHH-type rel operon transcriptional repressor/antitoxin RelB